jgi:hypothetical protein
MHILTLGDEGTMIFQNISNHLPRDPVSHPSRRESSETMIKKMSNPAHIKFPDYDAKNFILILMYTWHVSCRWYTSHSTQSPQTFKNLSHHGTKACAPTLNKSMSSFCSQEMAPCFMQASTAYHLAARGLLRSGNIRKSLGLILPTTHVTDCSSTSGRLWTTLPTLKDGDIMIIRNISDHSLSDIASHP